MVQISKDDVLKVARLSHIDIHDDEIEKVAAQLQSILSYAARVQEITQDSFSGCSYQAPADVGLHNVIRPDVVKKTDPEPILQSAPEREGNYFVVPVIIEAGQ